MTKREQHKRLFALLIIGVLVTISSKAICQITGIKLGGDPCTSLTLALQATGTSSAPSFFWNFGDPASGTSDTITVVGANTVAFPTHTFSAPGLYNVCVTFTEPGEPIRTVCRQLLVGLCCNGVISSFDSCAENVIPFSLVTDAVVTSINWNFGDPASSNNTANGASALHRFSAPGTYNVTATVAAGCGSFTVSKNVTIKTCLPPILCTGSIISADTCIANGTQFGFQSDSAIIGLNWNFDDPASQAANQTTSLGPKHRFTDTGTYTVRVVVNLSCGTLTVTKTLVIISCIVPPDCDGITGDILNSDSCVASNIGFTFSGPQDYNSINWNFGDPQSGSANQSTLRAPNHLFSAAGSYSVTATVDFVCGTLSFSKPILVSNCTPPSCEVLVANAFSPNGDGINDVISPLVNCITNAYDWKIFNRWGQQVFHSKNSLAKWDGTLKQKPLPAGVYYYTLKYKLTGGQEVNKSGSITLVR